MTKKEMAKKEIALLINGKDGYSARDIHEGLSQVTTISIDTVRAALNELVKEKVLVKTTDNKTAIFVRRVLEKPKTKRSFIKPMDIDKTTRGWKMRLAAKWLEQLGEGDSFHRRHLAKALKTDERNTHIMISKLREKNQVPSDVEYDRKTRHYFVPEMA